MADNRITRARLRDHVHYSWWKYALWTVLAVMAVDVLFTATQPRVPEERKVELYLCNGTSGSEVMHDALWPVLQAACPEQEELQVLNFDLTGGDFYAATRFTACVAAGQGDILLLPVSEAAGMASGAPDSIFAELTPYVERGLIPVEGIDLTLGTMAREDGSQGLYGIPTDTLAGLREYGCDPAGGLLCLTVYGGNLDASAALVGRMVERFSEKEPEIERK